MIQIIVIISYLAVTTGISLIFRKRAQKSTNAFYTSSRSLGTLVVAALLFSEIIAGAGTIGNAANAFTAGLSNAIWANWGMALGCILVVLTVAKFYRAMAEKYGVMTIPEAYAIMFGPRVRIIMLIIVALVYVILYSSQAPAAATIIAPLLGLDETLVTWAITALFIIISIFGGMVGASWMSLVHSIVLFVGIAIVAGKSVNAVGGLSVMTAELPQSFFSIIGDHPFTTLASALGTAISFLASSNVTNALFGASSTKSAYKGIIIAGILVIPFALLPAITGMAAKIALPDIAASNALFLMSESLGTTISSILSMAIIAAIWSTGPTLLLVVSATLTKDMYKTIINKNASEKQQLRFSYVVIVVAGVLGTLLGINSGSILDNMLGAFQIRSIVGIVLLAALVWPRVNSTSAFWSMLGGGAVAAGWFLTGNPFGISPLWPGAAVCLIVLITLSLCSKQKVSDGFRKYYDACAEMGYPLKRKL